MKKINFPKTQFNVIGWMMCLFLNTACELDTNLYIYKLASVIFCQLVLLVNSEFSVHMGTSPIHPRVKVAKSKGTLGDALIRHGTNGLACWKQPNKDTFSKNTELIRFAVKDLAFHRTEKK